MKPAAREWIEKAEADFISAGREYRARNYAGQQALIDVCTEW